MTAVMMSPEQFAVFMANHGMPSGGRGEGGGGGRKVIHGKTFSRMAKFSKGEENWKDWSFDFGVTLDSASSDMKETLRVIETVQEDMDVEKVTALDTERAANMNLNKLSKELYEVLVMLTEGEAKMMVRTVRNNDGIAHGIRCTRTTIRGPWEEY